MAVKTTIGQPARKDDYFERPTLTAELMKKIEAGCNIPMTAPRRVGKSTIMFYFLDNPPKNYRLIYMDTESVNNENEFYKRLFNHVVDTLSGAAKYKKIVTAFSKSLASRIESIGANGISIGDSRLSYYDELVKLLKKLDLNEDHLLIMLDEFAETVQNIIKDEDRNKAVHFLQSNRTLRMMPELIGKIQFIMAGSIGLENVVDFLDAPGTINDLYSFPIPPLKEDEARALTQKIIAETYTFNETAMVYMFIKLEWLIPFYIQLMVDEIDKLDFPGNSNEITRKEVDLAFEQAIKHRNYFSNWHARLRRTYSGGDYKFVKAVLNIVSEKDTVSNDDIRDLAVKHEVEDNASTLINALKYDGYINNNDNPKVFRFNSPLLKMWWYKNVVY